MWEALVSRAVEGQSVDNVRSGLNRVCWNGSGTHARRNTKLVGCRTTVSVLRNLLATTTCKAAMPFGSTYIQMVRLQDEDQNICTSSKYTHNTLLVDCLLITHEHFIFILHSTLWQAKKEEPILTSYRKQAKENTNRVVNLL